MGRLCYRTLKDTRAGHHHACPLYSVCRRERERETERERTGGEMTETKRESEGETREV